MRGGEVGFDGGFDFWIHDGVMMRWFLDFEQMQGNGKFGGTVYL